MINPFEKRATEYIRDSEAFLAMVSPEPLNAYISKYAKNGNLYDRLVRIVGTPGSGKTTIATLFQYKTIAAVLRNSSVSYAPIIDALTSCGAIANGTQQCILGCRLPLESDYRVYWELPYPDELKSGLLISMIQARSILGWIRNLTNAGHSLEDIRFVTREDAEGAFECIGGAETKNILARAKEVEKDIYLIAAALVPPRYEQVRENLPTAYMPFDVIESIMVKSNSQGDMLPLRPLMILDDVHSLHDKQFQEIQSWLSRRELRVARWMLMRFDILSPQESLNEVLIDTQTMQSSATRNSRDVTSILLQQSDGRLQQRKLFRKMARDMANRYLSQMSVFRTRKLTDLASLLDTTDFTLSDGKIAEIKAECEKAQRKFSISDSRMKELESSIDDYTRSGKQIGRDVYYATLLVLMNRYVKRTPNRPLFGDIEPFQPLTVRNGVIDGAEIHLLHKYGRPYYFGIDELCDAATENAEQFLHLSSILVDVMITRLIRQRNASLSAENQHKLLRDRAGDLINQWGFPRSHAVKIIVDEIGKLCVEKSLQKNAPLNGGAIAIGIPQEEFPRIVTDYPELAQILHFAVAYNALSLVYDHSTKGRKWCLLELGGLAILKHGLTLKRGGFIEFSTAKLNKLISHEASNGQI